ncbi:unnamed protein product, partial [Meganyctiphanes norvegica]
MMSGGSPDFEAAVGLIRHLTTEELRELVSNEAKTTDLIKDLPQMKNLVSEQEMLLAANKSLAEFNLSLEPKLSQPQQRHVKKNLQHSQLHLSTGTYQNCGPHKLINHLQTSLISCDIAVLSKTDNLVQSFLDKQQEVDQFLTEFLEKRKNAHLRRIKAEKISEINNPVVNNSHSSGPLPYPPQQWAPAYPPNPSMPMPGF